MISLASRTISDFSITTMVRDHHRLRIRFKKEKGVEHFLNTQRRSGEASKRWKLVRRHKIAKRNSTTPADTCITQDNAGCRKRRRYFMLEKCCCRLKRNKLLWSFWPGRTFQVPYHYSVDIFIQRIYSKGEEEEEESLKLPSVL